MLGAGRLTERINVVRPTHIQRGGHYFKQGFIENNYVEFEEFEMVEELNTILETYANVRELRVSNDMIASQEDITETLELTIRYRQDVHIKNGDKILWRGRQLEIIGLPSGFINRKEIRIIARMINETTDNG